MPEGKIALGKLAQALVHGARLLQVQGNFDDCLDLCRALSEDYPTTLVNSVNPDRIEGQKTAAFEVCDALGDAPDVHCLPVGNAGNITAYWKGYGEYAADGTATPPPAHARLPGRRRRADRVRPARARAVDDRHRDPHRQPRVVAAGAGRARRVRRRHPGGHRPADPVAPTACSRRRRASSSSRPRRRASPGCCRRPQAGLVEAGRAVVCTVTGNGLKDPDWAIAGAPKPVTVANSAPAAAAALGLA